MANCDNCLHYFVCPNVFCSSITLLMMYLQLHLSNYYYAIQLSTNQTYVLWYLQIYSLNEALPPSNEENYVVHC